MTEQIYTDFVNRPSTGEPSTSLVRVRTDACESIVNSILHYNEYDFHKNDGIQSIGSCSIRVPLKTRRVGERCTLNLVRAQTSSPWCGVVVRRGSASSGDILVT
ncbi:hypothetical protein TNCV_4345081 [Trichonephila clavipes]|nr:hypothetical protein TNCV_4345081 [Trichonephila clavipes]